VIVSASRRTDIPALHADWFAARMEAGWAEVVHPFRPSEARRIDLRPSPEGTMEAMVLWTRDPAPLLPHLPGWEARGVRTAWLVTLTGYPRLLEPHAPGEARALEGLENLAALVGRERIAWRYDPVVVAPASGLDAAFHRENFARLARRVAPFAARGIVSLYDDYGAARRRLARAGIVVEEKDRAMEALSPFADTARAEGIALQSCSEDAASVGISPGGCLDGGWLDGLWSLGIGAKRDRGQRPGCRCAPSADVGAYDSCIHGCLYCYAVRNAERAAERYQNRAPRRERLS